MKKTSQFRRFIESREITLIPGVADALGAKLAERAGFKAVFLSGYAASATLLGAPDVGLLTMTEMAECARRIADAVQVPVFADGDNGAAERALAHLQAAGSTAGFTDIMQFDEFNRLIGLDDLRRKESELYAAIQQR